MDNNKKDTERPVLLNELLDLVGKCKQTYQQERVFHRALALVMAELFAFGRHTITQLLLTLGIIDEDWSAWYRLFSQQRFDEEKTAVSMIGEMLSEVPETAPFMVGEDGFHVPRCSQTMPGTGWMRGMNTAKFKPGIQRGQRFVEGSWITPPVNGYSRAIPIRCLPAFTQKAVPSEAGSCTEVEAALSFLEWTRQQMDKLGRAEQTIVTLNDGSYDTLRFWPGLPDNTIGIVRTARNRCLYHLPPAIAHGNRKYGEKASAPHEYLKKRKGFTYQTIMVRGQERRMRYRLEGPFLRDGLPDIPLMLLVVGGGKRPKGSRRKTYKPCYFLVSAIQVDGVWTLPFSIIDTLTWLWQRWELEVAHRQMKSGLGLGEKQCWNDNATTATVQWSTWIYTLMMLTGYRVWGNDCGVKPPGQWRAMPRRWSFNTLWSSIRAEMWKELDFRATWTWSRDNWLRNESLLDNLFNATLASARV